jgi:hypothetical protein
MANLIWLMSQPVCLPSAGQLCMQLATAQLSLLSILAIQPLAVTHENGWPVGWLSAHLAWPLWRRARPVRLAQLSACQKISIAVAMHG